MSQNQPRYRTDAHTIRPGQLKKLFTNHMDAWGLALIIAALVLVVHQSTGLQVVSLKSLSLLVAIAVLYWLGFAYNDYHDAPFDALEPDKARGNFFVANPVPERWVKLGLALSSLFLLLAFAQFGWPGLAALALSLVVMWAYSGRPLRLKSRPGLDLATHALFVESYPYLVTLVLIGVAWTRLDLVLIAIFFVASLASQLEQQAADIEVDARTEPNFATRIGPERTMVLLRFFTAVLIAICVFFVIEGTIPGYLIPFGLITFPMLAHRFFRKAGQPRSRVINRYTLVAGLLYAGLVLALAALF